MLTRIYRGIRRRCIHTYRSIRYRLQPRTDDEFMRDYQSQMARVVRSDPKNAAGGLWDELGAFQLTFLQSQGLEPHHSLLDIGCGTLRGGHLFIRYLDPEGYTGFDISPDAIAFGKRLVEQEGLTHKRPTLFVNDSLRLDFAFATRQYDFLFAQSVFTHLRQSLIEECFASLNKVMHPKSVFYYTFFEGHPQNPQDEPVTIAGSRFLYPVSFFSNLASRFGLKLSQHPEYGRQHPRHQQMLSVRPI